MQRRHTNNCLLLHSPDTRQIVSRRQRRSLGPAAVYRLCCFRLSATKQQTTVRRWRGKRSKQRLISFSSPYVSPKRSMLTFSFSSANGVLALYHMHTVWSHPLPPSPVSGYLPPGLSCFIASFPLSSLSTKRAAPCRERLFCCSFVTGRPGRRPGGRGSPPCPAWRPDRCRRRECAACRRGRCPGGRAASRS